MTHRLRSLLRGTAILAIVLLTLLIPQARVAFAAASPDGKVTVTADFISSPTETLNSTYDASSHPVANAESTESGTTAGTFDCSSANYSFTINWGDGTT